MPSDERPRPRRTRLAVLTVGVALVLPLAVAVVPDDRRAAPSQYLRFPVVADTYVSAAQPDAVLGASRALVTAPGRSKRTYLRFVVTGVRGRVTAATLRVFVTSKLTRGFAVAAADDVGLDERTTADANAPGVGEIVGSSGTVTGKGWSFVSVTPLVEGDGSVTLALLAPEDVTTFASRESGAEAQLIVRTGRPRPAAAAPARPAGWSDRDPVIGAAGDIACDPTVEGISEHPASPGEQCQQMATSDLLLRDGVVAVLPLGDNQYEDGTLAKYRASYGPSWGRLKRITRPVPGNHEYVRSGDSPDALGYFRYFGAAAGDPAKGYYSYDIGSWHLIALNSQCGALDGCRAGSRQERWLRRDLADHPARCTLAYWHEPRFSSGPHGQEPVYDDFWRDLYAGGVDVVLNGHNHVYERFAPQDPDAQLDPARGIREFVVGTGGRNHYSPDYAFGTVQPNSEVRNAQTFGVLELTLHDGGYDWHFVPTAGGTFTDAGTGSCH
jgi:acid phosphatase type 7